MFFVDAVHIITLYICSQIVGSKALWSLCLLLYVLPTQNKSCLVLSYLAIETTHFQIAQHIDF